MIMTCCPVKWLKFLVLLDCPPAFYTMLNELFDRLVAVYRNEY